MGAESPPRSRLTPVHNRIVDYGLGTLLTPPDRSNYFVYEQTVEGMFVKALGPRISPRMHERLKTLGLDLKAPLRATYPLPLWMDFLDVAHQELFPTLSMDAAFREMGMLLVTGFGTTAIGRAVLAVARLLGPRRTLYRTTQQFRAANNFVEAEVREVTPTHFEVRLNEVGRHPSLTQGIFLAGLQFAGAQSLSVKMENYDGHACTYVVLWASKDAANTR